MNAGIQVVWGGILAVSLQARSSALGGGNGVRAYAIVAASGALVATIVQLVAGPLSDRLRERSGNRQIFYAAGIAFALPALAWFFLATDFSQLVAAFLCLELAMNVAGGPYQAVIADYVALDRRGNASSWMAAYQSIGNAAGLLAAGFIADLRFVALALAAPLAVTYAVSASAMRGLSDLAPPQQPAHATRGSSPLGTLANLLVSRGLINLGFFTLLGFLLFFVRDTLHVAAASVTTQTALLFLSFTLAAVAGAALAAGPTDRYDKRIVVTLAVALIVVALGALAEARALPVAFATAALAGTAWGAFVTADWALASAVLPARTLATGMGVWNVATALPQVVAPLLAAPLVGALDRTHAGDGPRGAIVLALCEFALGAVVVWRLPRA
ncbi:MAG: MFS transporter [Candidatus Eremiobacteraeota bacterium]|nr:MFS transporter [Candidatus Eremiobacteraeota bacterium]